MATHLRYAKLVLPELALFDVPVCNPRSAYSGLHSLLCSRVSLRDLNSLNQAVIKLNDREKLSGRDRNTTQKPCVLPEDCHSLVYFNVVQHAKTTYFTATVYLISYFYSISSCIFVKTRTNTPRPNSLKDLTFA